jgi:hypothetical protein
MKKIFAAMTAALLMVALVSSVALAANTGKGSATQFTASYPSAGATWTCTGTHVANKNVVKDNETCLITGTSGLGFVAGTFQSTFMVGTQGWGFLPPYNFDGLGNAAWGSDYNGTVATSWTVISTDNGNGTFTWNIAAIY